jgi:hypothetical protein
MPLPPYAKILLQYQKYQIELDYLIFLYVGKDAWRDCKKMLTTGQYAMCLPYDSDVTDYEWPITGLKICIVDTGGMTLDALRRIRAYLLLDNPQYLLVQTDLH